MVAVRAAGLPALLLACLSWEIPETFNITGMTPTAGMTPADAVYSLLTGLTSWLWVVAILSYGMRYLARSNGLLRYLNEATYPAYALHMPILSLIALYVVRWDLPLLVKLVLIVVATLAATLAVYDLLVRRLVLLRLLFGLKARPLRKPPRSMPNAAVAQSAPHSSVPVGAGSAAAALAAGRRFVTWRSPGRAGHSST
jgi:peptidoglycan/LPS O-acetylase OafA/YrhL